MKVLVTGGSGKVGRHVVDVLLQEGHEVGVFDLVEPQQPEARFFRGDILRPGEIADAVEGFEAVVHLAAIPWLIESADKIMEVNVLGTHRVLDAAANAGVKRFVFASSDSVYGFLQSPRTNPQPQYIPVDEEHPVQPENAYGVSKLLGEQLCLMYERGFGLETVRLRYCWVWFPETYQEQPAIASDVGGRAGTLWGYVDARDVGQAVHLSLITPDLSQEVFLIAAANTFVPRPSLEMAIEHYRDLTAVRKPRQFADNPYRSLFNTAKAKRILGYEAKYNWRDIVGN